MTTMEDAPLLLSLADVARLTNVQRPVASMWRSRSRGTAHPFPPAVTRRGNQDLFDAGTVADWLEATGRGNNPEAAQDAAAHLSTADLDVTELTAVLALRALADRPLAGADVGDLLDLADEIDPDDEFLFRELEGAADRLSGLVTTADRMADAAYSPSNAFEKILRERFRTGLDDYARSALSEDLLTLAAQTALTMAETTGAERFTEVTPGGSDLILTVARDLGEAGHAQLSLGTLPHPLDGPAADAPTRLARRRLHVAASTRDDLTIGFGPGGPNVILAQLPGPASTGVGTAEILAAVDELALSLGQHDVGLVIGPARVLADRLTGATDVQRSQTLRLGRARAIVRLGTGLAPARVRESLALWVLGADQRVPIAERRTMVADLGAAVLDTSAQQDLITDLAASLGGARDLRAHAFRFARLVPTSALLADGGSLTSRPRRAPPGTSPAPTADRLVRAERLLEDFATRGLHGGTRDADAGRLPLTVEAGSGRPAEWTTLDALLADGSLRYLPGTRLRDDELGSEGLRVLDAAPGAPVRVDGTSHLPHRASRVNQLWLAAHHPIARLTEPGDVVFRTGLSASAVVDRIGSAVVRSPARALRITPSSGLVPDVLAADLAYAPSDSWRTGLVRRFTPDAAEQLATALGRLAETRDALERQLGRLHDVSTLIITGIAAGDLHVTSNPEAHETEGIA